MNYWNKDKRSNTNSFQKKRPNWNQSLRSPSKLLGPTKPKKLKKSLQYLLVLRKFKNIIDYKNVRLLRAFLTKYGKIRARRKTRISVQTQHAVARAIRKARDFKVIPFTIDVKI